MLAEKGMTAFDLAGYVGDCRDERKKKGNEKKERKANSVMPGCCACFALNYYTGKLFMILLLMRAVGVSYALGTAMEKDSPCLSRVG